MNNVRALEVADNANIVAMLAAKFLQSVAEIDFSGYISHNFGLRLTSFNCKNIEVPSYLSTSKNGGVEWSVDAEDCDGCYNYHYGIEFSTANGFELMRDWATVAVIAPSNAIYEVTKTIYNQLKKWCKEKNKRENNDAFLTSYTMTHTLRCLGFEVERKFDTAKCTCYIFKLDPEHSRMRGALYDKHAGNARAIAEAIKKEFSNYENFAFNVEYHSYAPELIKIHASNLEFS